MPGIARDAGVDVAGGLVIQGSGNVFADTKPVVRIGDAIAWHGKGPHASPVMSQGSSNVFANNIAVSRAGDVATCGHPVSGSSDVFVNEPGSVDRDTVSNRTMNAADEEDAVNPGGGAKLVAAAVASGAVSSTEVSAGGTPVVGTTDNSSGTNAGVVLSTDCSDIAALTPFPAGDAIDNIQLSPNFTVGKMTRKPHVTFDHALRSGSGGLSLEEIVCNLKMLAVNVVEPMKAQYPSAFLTNTWRPAGIGSSTSQHPKGMACDIQFKGASKADYFAIAQWFRDNLVYDQLLLEYKTTGSGLPWIHISFNKTNNRKQVLTLLNNSTHSQGLTDLSGTG
jgi:uncharacterized Zn-binding protein involved in type VI secretion